MMEIDKGNTKFIMAIDSPEQLKSWLQENQNAISIAMLGRSNVGKSTLINSLFGKSVAITSKTPGRTRKVNIFTFQIDDKNSETELPLFYLFDLPGYGHAKVSREMSEKWKELLQVFFELLPQTSNIVNLQDARHPNQKADQNFKTFLNRYDFSTTLVFNKLDKLKTQKERAQLNKLKPELFKEYKYVDQIFFVSAEKRTGVQQLNDSLISFLIDQHQNQQL